MADTDDKGSPVGLILAAGLGSRLMQGGPKLPKPLVSVEGTPLLFRTLRSLHRAGCERVVVVLGHCGEQIRQAVLDDYRGPVAVEFVHNPEFRRKNGLSVLAAKDQLAEPFVLTMADHVFSDDVMDVVRGHVPPAGGASLFVDRRTDTVLDLDDATKVRTDGDHIVEIGKDLAEYDCIDTGVFVATFGLVDALSDVRAATGDASLSDGMKRLASLELAQAVDIGKGFWQDVDTPQMLAEAERILRQRA